MRAGPDVFELFSITVVPFSDYVSRKTPLLSINLGQKRAMLLSPAVYVRAATDRRPRCEFFRDAHRPRF
jgi:hypothetical protein